MAININAKTSGAGGLETTADNTGNINIQSGGSTVMSVTSSGVAVTGSFSQNGAVYSTQPSFRNLIINGDMRIDQRNSGASVTPVTNQYTLDRFQFNITQTSKLTAQQNAGAITPPTGFTNYLGITSTSAYSITAGDTFVVRQKIEGNNIAHLGWGTANAKTVTLSFWVRSSLTGTFGGSLKNASSDAYPFSYSISSANTWEQKSITIPGSTSGTWATDNTTGMFVQFGLGAGSTFSATAGVWNTSNSNSATGATSVVGTSGATFYITGVQLEVGTTATDFENLPYDVELARCQRYFQSFGGSNVAETVGQGTSFSTISTYVLINLLQTMRSVPSLGYSAVGDWRLHYPGVTGQEATAMSIATNDSNNTKVIVNTTTATNASMGGGKCIQLTADSTISARLTFDAEL